MKTPSAKVSLVVDDDVVVLYDTLGVAALSKEQAFRNIYRISKSGDVVWQVARRPEAGGPFTNVYFEDGCLKAYAWDGGNYTLDLDTGAILSSELMR